MNKEYDFIVGFTLFTPTGFRTMYRHFDNLEVAKMFASNVNIKDNCKIYVDLDLYNEEKEKNNTLLVELSSNNYISKDKIREKIKELERDKKKLYKEQGNIEDIKIYSVIDIIKAEILRFKELLED